MEPMDTDEQQIFLKADEVIASRSGQVLLRHTVLKADHFPACHNTKLTPILEGAPNFRQVEGLPVYGVAIPTSEGLRNALNSIGADNGKRKVYWNNLREEPLVFIRGQPFVVREQDQPFCNLEYTGIDRSRVEEMEQRLKQDILKEVEKFGNKVLVMHENADLSLFDQWEPVSAAEVQTPREVYQQLIDDGYDVDYMRIPITDEKAPKDNDFELLIQRLWNVHEGAAVIFNCQMGRGRTTTGTIIASLLFLRRIHAFPATQPPSGPPPSWFSTEEPAQTDLLKAGMYGVIRSLKRALEHGVEAKNALDRVIDAASAMQNLREAIASYRSRFLKEAAEHKKNAIMSVCLEYLERYYMLMAFTSYLFTPNFNPSSPSHVPFQVWVRNRPELTSILQRLLRRNPLAALELHLPAQRGLAAQLAPSGEEASEAENEASRVIFERSGAVLGQYTILKEDNFPGMRCATVPQLLEGAANFRGQRDMLLYGLAMPTMAGIQNVLRSIAQSTGRAHNNYLWLSMREEPVVYINGSPFVLREERRPLKNMMEYQGIDAARLQAMEDRLKQDVLAECKKFGGRVLVARESVAEGHVGQLTDAWEVIISPATVQTPAEVYKSLRDQGYNITYVRIPVTDGTAPLLRDFDAMIAALMSVESTVPVIFNCQMGIGRTTTGMVIAGLLRQVQSHMNDNTVASIVLDDSEVKKLHDMLEFETSEGNSPRGERFDDEDGNDEDPKVWDFTPEELEEQRTLALGGYMGVRRMTRLLEAGESCKKKVDLIINGCSQLINLRTAILKYHKPRRSYKYQRPEMQQRHAAFKRGSAYLERYCLLIAYCYYINHIAPRGSAPFSEWVASRPDLMTALNAIHQNPAAALMAVPSAQITSFNQEGVDAIPTEEQKEILAKRHGRTMTKRTILKSYQMHDADPLVPEVPALRRADAYPVYSTGHCHTRAMAALLQYLGADANGKSHVVISDVREELVVYINGCPYMRRELEMPAEALHAGVTAEQLEEQEVLLKEDVEDESVRCEGKVMVHKEAEMDVTGDVTALQDRNPGLAVTPCWEVVDVNDEQALMTAYEVSELLTSHGFHLTYRRIPLSRQRTPVAVDMEHLHMQMQVAPSDPARKVVHLVMSRRSMGASNRFVAALLCSSYVRMQNTSMLELAAAQYQKRVQRSASGLGEYRGIMSVCRLLPGGLEAKLAVDAAIDECGAIGNLREDIRSCKHFSKTGPPPSAEHPLTPAIAAQQLGVHYLKRYFLLITYRCYADSGSSQTFTQWMHERKELHHMLENLGFD